MSSLAPCCDCGEVELLVEHEASGISNCFFTQAGNFDRTNHDHLELAPQPDVLCARCLAIREDFWYNEELNTIEWIGKEVTIKLTEPPT